jgi:GxxExxY protein
MFVSRRADRLPEGFREIRESPAQPQDYPLRDVTEKIIGCAIRVHRELHAGFLEDVYEKAMLHELRKAGLRVDCQATFPVMYDGLQVGEHRADLVAERSVAVELKAVRELTDQHACQLMSTMKAAGTKVGLLINFNVAQLVQGIRRFVM